MSEEHRQAGMKTERFQVRAATGGDRDWVRSVLRDRWGGPEIATRGRLHSADSLPGFIAAEGERPVGLITYALADAECEIVSLDALEPGKGVGSALVSAVLDLAHTLGCKRVWLVTTNDNTKALRFYQKMGFALAAIHRDGVTRARQLKPGIPKRGCDGIPIRDEIELEIRTR
jgi:RimJ/RimL family protein N-acetyltransferase